MSDYDSRGGGRSRGRRDSNTRSGNVQQSNNKFSSNYGNNRGRDEGNRSRDGGNRGRGGSGRGRDGGSRGRGGSSRGGGRLANKPGPKKSAVIIEQHRHAGVFVIRGKNGKDDMLATLNLVPGTTVYGEKKVLVENEAFEEKKEYRQWNPFRSKLGAAILRGISDIYMKPGSKVLYLGAASGTTVSHVSDILGPTGVVYAVEMAHRPGRELIEMAKVRTNIVPIIEDARYPQKYRMLMPMVDMVFADVAQRAQAQILSTNCAVFLRNGGHFVISVKASCIDSTVSPAAVFAKVKDELIEQQLKPLQQIPLEPYERDHAVITGIYRAGKREKKTQVE